jgi:hypothetical protein
MYQSASFPIGNVLLQCASSSVNLISHQGESTQADAGDLRVTLVLFYYGDRAHDFEEKPE